MSLHTFYDNTAKVKAEAARNEAEIWKALQNDKGNETQAFHTGQTVSGDGHGFDKGTIIEVYKEHGYIRYVVEHGKRKKYRTTLRQKDIKLI